MWPYFGASVSAIWIASIVPNCLSKFKIKLKLKYLCIVRFILLLMHRDHKNESFKKMLRMCDIYIYIENSTICVVIFTQFIYIPEELWVHVRAKKELL